MMYFAYKEYCYKAFERKFVPKFYKKKNNKFLCIKIAWFCEIIELFTTMIYAFVRTLFTMD